MRTRRSVVLLVQPMSRSCRFSWSALSCIPSCRVYSMLQHASTCFIPKKWDDKLLIGGETWKGIEVGQIGWMQRAKVRMNVKEFLYESAHASNWPRKQIHVALVVWFGYSIIYWLERHCHVVIVTGHNPNNRLIVPVTFRLSCLNTNCRKFTNIHVCGQSHGHSPGVDLRHHFIFPSGPVVSHVTTGDTEGNVSPRLCKTNDKFEMRRRNTQEIMMEIGRESRQKKNDKWAGNKCNLLASNRLFESAFAHAGMSVPQIKPTVVAIIV